MSQPEQSLVPPAPAPARASLRRWVGSGLLVVGAGLFVWCGYLVWQRATAPTPPEVDLASVEPMVADSVRAARDAVTRSPRDPGVWGHLGMVLHAHRLLKPAQECYAHAERFDPGNPHWPYLAGHCEAADGDPNRAVELFRRAASRSGGEPFARLRLGEALIGRGAFGEAEAVFREVAASHPSDPRANFGLARVALDRGDARAAVSHLDRCLARVPDAPWAHALLAAAYHDLGESEQAAEARLRAGAKPEPPDWPDPYLAQVHLRQTGLLGTSQVARTLSAAGRKQEALQLLEDLVRRYPESGKARGELGRFRLAEGDLARAEAELREALRLEPQLIDLQLSLGVVLGRREKREEAVAWLRKVVEAQPDAGEAHLTLGQLLYDLGDKEGSARALREAVRYRPNSALAQKNLGAVLFETGKYAEAVPALENAATLAPGDAQTRTLLTRAKILRGPDPPK